MSTRALELLARLEQQELDRQRRKLAGEETVRERLEHSRQRTRTAIGEAIDGIEQLHAGSDGGPEALPLDVAARLIEGGRRRASDLERAMTIQERRCHAAREELNERIVAVKRLEIVAERRRRAARAQRDRREQQEMEENAIMRHGRE
ncbi:MAG: hypothetical protein R3C70_13600 [Geminicoccaceae bacterium]|nr:hypothetical protein [Geminicoccaceae bacterium]